MGLEGPELDHRSPHIAKLAARNRARHQGDHLYEDDGWMRDAYLNRQLSLRQIAEEAKCGVRTIARWIRIHEIPIDHTRKPRRYSGADHPRWAGGPDRFRCFGCGKQCSFGRTQCNACRDRSDELGPNWHGDDVEYMGLHGRLVAKRGKAVVHACEHCAGQAEEWAYDHTDPDEKRNRRGRDDGAYSLDIDRYMPLCVPCHRQFDPTGGPGRSRTVK